jgi:predicted nuclease with TOPRIM domain
VKLELTKVLVFFALPDAVEVTDELEDHLCDAVPELDEVNERMSTVSLAFDGLEDAQANLPGAVERLEEAIQDFLDEHPGEPEEDD